MKDTTNEFLQALLVAPTEQKKKALQILRGDMPVEAAPTSDGPQLMGMSAAARYLGLSRTTMWRLIESGRIKRFKLMEKSYRIRRADLDAFVKGGAL